MAEVKPEDMVHHPPMDQLQGFEYCIDSNPSWGEAIALGFQHYILSLGTAVMIPTMLVPLMGGNDHDKARVVQTLLFVTGIKTLLQTLFGTRLPTIMGGSYAYIIPILSIIRDPSLAQIADGHTRFLQAMRSIQGALIVSSSIQIILGYSQLWAICSRFFSPLAMVPVVALVGFGLFERGFPVNPQLIQVQHLSGWEMCGDWSSNAYPICRSFTISQACACPACSHFGEVLTADMHRSCLGICPHPHSKWCIQAYGTCHPDQLPDRPCQPHLFLAMDKHPIPITMGRTNIQCRPCIRYDGCCAGLFNRDNRCIQGYCSVGKCNAPTSICPEQRHWMAGYWHPTRWAIWHWDWFYCFCNVCLQRSENVGLLGSTRVGSRRVIQISAGFMIFFSMLGKFGALFASIPFTIFAAVYCVMFGIVAAVGLSFMQFTNMNSMRNLFIIGVSLFLGLSIPEYFSRYSTSSQQGPAHTKAGWFNDYINTIFSSPPTVALFVAVLLDNTLDVRDAARDRGMPWWARFRTFRGDSRNEEFYTLPFNLNRFFPPS
ncbi:nucleobase-ascorbate transporter 2-like isoform X1 [Phragmites australis]|uniref:nucleobase-ascorbate transporter 2-like isoform X1 n=1 Tax=Phragmites australis TaxID=29695 RepID=UPI002D789225|nr:nucleobase-ascorbate transporter 2-like isoform X1 [Phragmites australis]